jgi:hypothetical protein
MLRCRWSGGLPGCAGRMLRMVTGYGEGLAAGMADGRAGRACPAAVLRGLRGSVPGARVSCRTVRLYVVINRAPHPGAAARPGSRQRAIELVQGAAGLPMVSGELMALRLSGLVPPPRGKLTGTACPGAGLSHAAAAAVMAGRAGISPAAMRASRIGRPRRFRSPETARPSSRTYLPPQRGQLAPHGGGPPPAPPGPVPPPAAAPQLSGSRPPASTRYPEPRTSSCCLGI